MKTSEITKPGYYWIRPADSKSYWIGEVFQVSPLIDELCIREMGCELHWRLSDWGDDTEAVGPIPEPVDTSK